MGAIHVGLKTLISLVLFLIVLLSGFAAAAHTYLPGKPADVSSSADYASSNTLYYPITIVEHGLPSSLYWNAEIGPANGTSYGSFFSTHQPTITYYEPSGNYSLMVWATVPNYASQNFYSVKVASSRAYLNVTFTEQYNFTVFEKGLPNGTSWGFNLIPLVQYPPTYSASTPPFMKSMWIWVPNGTYTLQVGQVVNSLVTPFAYNTKVTVNGSNVNFTIPFNGVNITETGLGSNTSWGLLISGDLGSHIADPTTNRSVFEYLPAGDIRLQMAADGYYSSPLNFSNNAPNGTAVVHFDKGYGVKFVENGLPDIANNSWYVKGFRTAFQGGNSYVIGNDSTTVLVPNGTYHYNASIGNQAWDINGTLYTVNITWNSSDNTFYVRGGNSTVYVYFTVQSLKSIAPVQPAINPMRLALYIIAGVVVAGVIAEVAYFKRRRA